MKSSIALLCPEFNMHRMVKQYTNDYYLVAHDRYRDLNGESGCRAKDMAAWLSRVEEAWPRLRVESVEDSVPEMDLGDRVQVSARVFLDALSPDDVVVESVLGRVGGNGEIGEFTTTPMQPCGAG
jgi:starch phosphorylase